MSQKFKYINALGWETESSAYEETDYIASTAGVADAGKVIKLNALGVLDSSFINVAGIDHGGLTGLGDDDHAQYTLADGTRDFSGKVEYNTSFTFTSPNELISKKYADDLFAGTEWQDSCIDRRTTPPAHAAGERYLVIATATGDWTGHENEIAESDGAAWSYTAPTTGMKVAIDDETDGVYLYTGGAWQKQSYEATTASLGCEKVGMDVRLDILSGGGLKLTGNEVGVEPNDFAGEGVVDDGSDNIALDWSTAFNDAKPVKASDMASTVDGYGASNIGVGHASITATNVKGALVENRAAIDAIEDNTLTSPNATITVGGTVGGDDQTVDVVFSTAFNDALPVKAEDLNSVVNGEGASIIGVEDSAGNFVSTNVEGALLELHSSIVQQGINYTASGAITKGDAVYVSANDSVSSYGTITSGEWVIGIAATTVSNGQTVKVLTSNATLDGFSGLTAGDRYYWTGSGWTSNFGSYGTGDYRWIGGTAKNATTIDIEKEFLGVQG